MWFRKPSHPMFELDFIAVVVFIELHLLRILLSILFSFCWIQKQAKVGWLLTSTEILNISRCKSYNKESVQFLGFQCLVHSLRLRHNLWARRWKDHLKKFWKWWVKSANATSVLYSHLKRLKQLRKEFRTINGKQSNPNINRKISNFREKCPLY